MVQNYISKNILGKRVSGRVDSTSLACSAEEVERERAAQVEPEIVNIMWRQGQDERGCTAERTSRVREEN